MSELILEVRRAEAAGDTRIAGFSGAVRSMELNTLAVGDVWTFPTNYEVYEQHLNSAKVQYIWITTEAGEHKKFYPSTFTKSREICELDGNNKLKGTGVRATTKGTAAELFRKDHATVDEAMNALKGKKCKVTALQTILTRHFSNREAGQNTQILTIDLV